MAQRSGQIQEGQPPASRDRRLVGAHRPGKNALGEIVVHLLPVAHGGGHEAHLALELVAGQQLVQLPLHIRHQAAAHVRYALSGQAHGDIGTAVVEVRIIGHPGGDRKPPARQRLRRPYDGVLLYAEGREAHRRAGQDQHCVPACPLRKPRRGKRQQRAQHRRREEQSPRQQIPARRDSRGQGHAGPDGFTHGGPSRLSARGCSPPTRHRAPRA